MYAGPRYLSHGPEPELGRSAFEISLNATHGVVESGCDGQQIALSGKAVASQHCCDAGKASGEVNDHPGIEPCPTCCIGQRNSASHHIPRPHLAALIRVESKSAACL